ncbi:MAG: hypothetical protein RIC87_18355 [Kiloniellales bacterium]
MFSRHGLDLQGALQQDQAGFEAKLTEGLPVDRGVPGFADFTLDGERPIEAGKPAASLLYHALASPLVHPDGGTQPAASEAYASLAELDLVENYIFSQAAPDLGAIRNPRIAVLAYQYRLGNRSPHGEHADLAFSRCGVARVGTEPVRYNPITRDFDSRTEGGGIRALAARYAAFLVDWRAPLNGDSVVAEAHDDRKRRFAFPLHKIFPGSDCLDGYDIDLLFHEFHRNEKLQRVHRQGGVRAVEGFDVDLYPFVRDSTNAGDLVRLEEAGASVVVQPMEQPTLVRMVEQLNRQSGKREPVRFYVPPRTNGNRFDSALLLPSRSSGARLSPEYVNIRHKVERDGDGFRVVDLKDSNETEFSDHLNGGNYIAAHFMDDSCDGVVSVEVSGLSLASGGPSQSALPAFSLVTAPDFLPMSDQIEITEWARNPRENGRNQFSQGNPAPLCEGRRPPNLSLPLPGHHGVSAFSESDETAVAIIGMQPLSASGQSEPAPRVSTSFLSDAASNEFAPGWDVSISEQGGKTFYASYGLGSPFPEDAKLCAALNSFWPAVAPDASRTFDVSWSPTAIPMLDAELGYHPDHPAVTSGRATTSYGWDGEQGPFFEQHDGRLFVNYAVMERSDYVTNVLQGRVHTAHTDAIVSKELIVRMEAMKAAIKHLPPSVDLVRSSSLWLVRAEQVEDWAAMAEAADPALAGAGLIYEFADVWRSAPVELTKIVGTHARRRRPVVKRYLCHISQTHLFWRDADDDGWAQVAL